MVRRRASLLAPLLLLVSQATAVAQVVPGGLGTRVNGSALGRCSSGVCRIQGGTPVGGNLLLRLNRYDTRSGIERVDLDTQQRQTVVVGVGDPAGSFFATPLKLNAPANLVWLSPGGLWLGAGMQVINAPSQLFTTSPSLRLGHGVFQAAGGEGALGGLGGPVDLAPSDPGEGSVGQRLGLGGSAPIVLAGGHLLVDRNLVLDSGRGSILSAAGSRTQIRAGGGIELTGGHLDVQKLQVEGGGSVTLQALADGGQARLRQSEIVGQQVLLRGNGGLMADGLTMRANGAGAAGRVQLETGTDPGAGADLRNVALQGQEVLLRAGAGDMTLTDTQLQGQQVLVLAGRQLSTQGLDVRSVDNPTGRVWLQGERADLRQTTLRGQEVVVDSRGDLRADGLTVTAGPTGREGSIWLQAGQGERGLSGASADLKRLTMQGQSLAAIAAGNLTGADWSLNKGSDGSTGTITVATGKDSLRNNGGSVTLRDANLTAKTVLLRANGGYSVQGGEAKADPGRTDTVIQFDTGIHTSGEGEQAHEDLLGGKASLQDFKLSGRQIVIRGGQGIDMQQVQARAGVPGDRGLIKIETQQGDDTKPGSTLDLLKSNLSARQITLKSGSIQILDESLLEAPKGWIHIEAQGKTNDPNSGSVLIGNSRLDLGLSNWEDLKAPVDSFVAKSNLKKDNPPTIGIFSTNNIALRDRASISSAQDLDTLEQQDPQAFWRDMRISDISGIVVLDAKNHIALRNSLIRADASHNLAGTVAVRSTNPMSDPLAGIEVSGGTIISASGGAGSGDIWLSSNNGVMISDSMLQSISDRASSTPDMFGGGEIALTNNSTAKPITVLQAQLEAKQVVTNKGDYDPRKKDGGHQGKIMTDPYDPSNDKTVNKYSARSDEDVLGLGGGVINLFSRGGIILDGPSTTVTTSSSTNTPRNGHQNMQSFGGVVRIVNTGSQQILIKRGATIASEINTDDPTSQYTRKSEVLIWSNGSVSADHGFVLAASRSSRVDFNPDLNPALSISSRGVINFNESDLTVVSSMDTASPNLRLRSLMEDGVNMDKNSRIFSQLGAHNPKEFSKENPISENEFYDQGKLSIPYEWQGIHGETKDLTIDKASGLIDDKRVNGDDLIQGIVERVKLAGDKTFSERPVLFRPERTEAQVSIQRPVQIDGTQSSRLPTLLDSRQQDLSDRFVSQPKKSADYESVSSANMVAIANHSLADINQASDQGQAMLLTEILPVNESIKSLQDGEDSSIQSTIRKFGIPSHQQKSFSLAHLQNALQSIRTKDYRLASIRIQLLPSRDKNSIDVERIMITGEGPPKGWRTSLPRQFLESKIRNFQADISQLRPNEVHSGNPGLGDILFGPLFQDLESQKVNALLLSLDRGLQGIPFAALRLNGRYLAEQYAITVTPSLGLTNLQGDKARLPARSVIAGASVFSDGLSPLPLARQEAEKIASLSPDSLLLFNDDFTLDRISEQLKSHEPIRMIHLATHADFTAEGSTLGRIYMRRGLLDLALLRTALSGRPESERVDLLVLSACRTSLGNETSELGLTGLALQVGAKSSLGTLWYVDDAASAAFLIKFHQFIARGLAKDIALRTTQDLFRLGKIKLVGNTIVDDLGDALVTGLSQSDQSRLKDGLGHPYYWSGMVLSGRPW